MYLPLLDGSDEVGVLALTLDAVDEDDRRLLRRLAGLVADMLVTKNSYTDQFIQARRSEPMTLAAEIQWALLPPTTMITPQVALAGNLGPQPASLVTRLTMRSTTTSCTWLSSTQEGHGLNAIFWRLSLSAPTGMPGGPTSGWPTVWAHGRGH
jgi:hypothetical protein